MNALVSMTCAALLVAVCPCSAAEPNKDFVEILRDDSTLTFDLRTLQMIQPGRFSIVGTTIDNAEVMKLRLHALSKLRTYCSRQDGKYPLPSEILTLGPADMPLKSIDVGSGKGAKTVVWYFPYKRLSSRTNDSVEQKVDFLTCRYGNQTEAQLYVEKFNSITNGHRARELFDCKRGLVGMFMNENDDPAKSFTYPVRPESVGETNYLRICLAVTREMPYLPDRPSGK